jgi:hypothetical protein
MTRKFLLFCFLTLFLSACLRPASDTPATKAPLDFPSPAPGSTPLCQPADLQTSSNSSDTGESLLLGLTLTNQTKNPCALTNPPLVTLLDSQNQPLKVETTTLALVQTPPAPVEMLLAPGESLIISLDWRNACQPLPKPSLTIRLLLAETSPLEISTPLDAGLHCADKTAPSTLTVTPYSYPP